MSDPDVRPAGEATRPPRGGKDKLAFDAIGTVLKGEGCLLQPQLCSPWCINDGARDCVMNQLTSVFCPSPCSHTRGLCMHDTSSRNGHNPLQTRRTITVSLCLSCPAETHSNCLSLLVSRRVCGSCPCGTFPFPFPCRSWSRTRASEMSARRNQSTGRILAVVRRRPLPAALLTRSLATLFPALGCRRLDQVDGASRTRLDRVGSARCTRCVEHGLAARRPFRSVPRVLNDAIQGA